MTVGLAVTNGWTDYMAGRTQGGQIPGQTDWKAVANGQTDYRADRSQGGQITGQKYLRAYKFVDIGLAGITTVGREVVTIGRTNHMADRLQSGQIIRWTGYRAKGFQGRQTDWKAET